MYSFTFHQNYADFEYTFSCDNGNTYLISFAAIQDIFEFKDKIEVSIYFLNIISTESKPKFDSNTSKTVIAITNDFFNRSPHSFLFYYPENNDGRDGSRTKIFDRWFLTHSTDNHSRIEYIINFEETILTAGLIFLTSNPEKLKGQKIVTDFIRKLNMDKDSQTY